MTGEKIKHLEFIQNVITRMNTNSFQIKGWTVIILSALLTIYASTKNEYFILAGIFPVLVFWFLDTYYLTQERKFRGLYNDVAGISDNPKKLKPFEMRPDLYTGDTYSYWNVFISTTIIKLYLSLTIILVGLFILF
ncbi:MAG: hypothetical protein ACTSVM_02015 [Candidatus Ranarchaeia archaeon]